MDQQVLINFFISTQDINFLNYLTMIKYLNTTSFGNLPLRVSYYALKMFKVETGKDFMLSKTDSSALEMADFETLLFYSLEKGHKMMNRSFSFTRDGKEIPFTKEIMEDVLDEVLFDFINIIPEFFPKGKNEPQTDVEKKEIPM